jgi:hypothetical protein
MIYPVYLQLCLHAVDSCTLLSMLLLSVPWSWLGSPELLAFLLIDPANMVPDLLQEPRKNKLQLKTVLCIIEHSETVKYMGDLYFNGI